MLGDVPINAAGFIAWEYERGTHRKPLTEMGSMLFREWLNLRDVVPKLLKLRAEKEAKAKSGR